MNIRKANPEDKKDIQELNNYVFINDADHDSQLDLDYPYTESGEKYYTNLANGTYGACYIAEDDGKAVGYVALAEKEFGYRHGSYLEIENIGVHPDYRSKGIGNQLMDKAAEYAKEKGFSRMYVAAYWLNKRAIKFYESCGFSMMGVELEREV